MLFIRLTHGPITACLHSLSFTHPLLTPSLTHFLLLHSLTSYSFTHPLHTGHNKTHSLVHVGTVDDPPSLSL